MTERTTRSTTQIGGDNDTHVITISYTQVETKKLPLDKDTIRLPMTGTTCVDERTEYEAPAVFGGDWGIFMAIWLALDREDKSAEEILKIILDAYEEAGVRFYIHTDDHGYEDPTHIGCGFTKVVLQHALQDPEKEHKAQQLQKLYHKIINHKFEHEALYIDTLKGSHNASAVVTVSSEDSPSTQGAPNFDAYTHIDRKAAIKVDGQEHTINVFVNNQETQALLIVAMLKILAAKGLIDTDEIEQAQNRVTQVLNTYIGHTLEELTATPIHMWNAQTGKWELVPENQRRATPVQDLPNIVV